MISPKYARLPTCWRATDRHELRRRGLVHIGDFDLEQPVIDDTLIDRRIEEYRDEAWDDGIVAPLELYREVFATQERHLGLLGVTMPPLGDLQIQEYLDGGTPLVDAESLRVDYATLKDLFGELKEVVARRSRAAEPGDREFLENVELSEDDLEEIGRAWLAGREDFLTARAAELGVDFSVLNLLLHSTFAAVFRKLARELQPHADLDQYPRATCPICGAPPVMGFNRDSDGLRVLECSLCGSRWGTPRMHCVFCRTPDQTKFRYLFVDGDRRRRVYVCENCRNYVKIVDLAERADEIVLPLEDIFTTYLDEVAEKEGFERGCRTGLS